MWQLFMYVRLMSAFERLKVVLLLINEYEINIVGKIIIYESMSALSESRGLWNEPVQCAVCSTFSYSWSGKPAKWRKFEGDISRKILPNKTATMAKSN
jgi:hypothetical protein